MTALVLIEVAESEALVARHGESTFDLLHAELVGRLESWVREQDTLSVLNNGRIIAYLKGLTNSGQLKLAGHKLTKVVSADFDVFGQHISLDVHAGITLLGRESDTEDGALKRAADALELARRNGSNFETFDADQSNKEVNESRLVEDLEDALDRGQFHLFFQPKVSASYRSLVGAEALIRWLRDDVIVPPAEFIDVAERNAVIKPMTLWAVKSAVARCCRWPGELSVAVNVPPSVLLDDDLYHIVHDTLELQALAPSRLTLEVTEGVMADQPEVMFRQLARFRKLGVRVALDDFGTGYSSMAYFRNLPADELKIDRSFVAAMAESEIDYAIVKAVTELARNFKLKVVAEGVETEEIAQSLLELGVDTLQGYLFDAPFAAEEFEKRQMLC